MPEYNQAELRNYTHKLEQAMLSRLFKRWSKSKAFTQQELAVLRLLLPVGNEYSQRLYLQAVTAPCVERKRIGVDGYEVTIPFVVDDSLLIECDKDIHSPPITFSTSSGRALTFATTIFRGGFLRGLAGRTSDGAVWTKDWAIDIQNASIPESINTWVPRPVDDNETNQVLKRLFDWSGVPEWNRDALARSSRIRVAAPATNSALEACEARLDLKLSPQYRELTSICDGFSIGRGRPCEVLGTPDLEYLFSDDAWLSLTPLYEDGCVAIHCNNRTATNDCFLLSHNQEPLYLSDLRQYVQRVLVGK